MKTLRLLIPLALVGLLLGGCNCGGGRDVSTPRKALLGHWKQTIPGYGEVYYDPKEVTYALKGQKKKPINIPVPYSVSGENKKAFSVDIKLESASGAARITFSEDRRTMTMFPANVPEKLEYVYMDDKQKP